MKQIAILALAAAVALVLMGALVATPPELPSSAVRAP
jgi:hypothetical protein